MGIPFISRDRQSSPQGMLKVTLTPEGLKSAEQFEGSGGEWDVMSALAMERPMSVGRLAKVSGMGYGDCLSKVKRLIRTGMVQAYREGMPR